MSRLEDRRGAKDGLEALGGAGSPMVAALDLGASKVACFIMKPDGVRHADRTIRVAGVGYVQSRGVRGGAIVNMDEAAQAIAQAVERAETVAGVARLGRRPSPPPSARWPATASQAQVSLGARPIGDADLARAIAHGPGADRASRTAAPIHLLPIAWSVDGAARRARSARHVRPRRWASTCWSSPWPRAPSTTLGHCLELAHLDLRGRGRRALRLVAGRAGGRRDGPGLRLHRHGRRLDLGGGVLGRRPCCTSTACRSAATTSPPTSRAACRPPSPAPSG